MLDIAVIIPQLAKYGGAERVVVECISRWQKKHKITIYASAFNKEMLKEHGINSSIALKQISGEFTGTEYSFLLNSTLRPQQWTNEIGQHDIYNAHLWPTHLINKAPMVWYPHEPLRLLSDLRYNQDVTAVTDDLQRKVHMYPKYSYDEINENLYEYMLNVVDRYDKTQTPFRTVANSKYTAQCIEDVYGTPVKDVVYPGVQPDNFLPPMDFDYILTVGQLWPHKRIRLVIEALSLVEGLQLYIVGSGPEEKKLRTMAERLGVANRVFFLNGLTNREVQIVFAMALAIVFTPVREPFGIVALEAMAASKPLIAVNEGGYVEVVDEQCAFLVPPNPVKIAAKIQYLKDNKDVAREMGSHGRELCEKYSWDHTADGLLEIIEDSHKEWADMTTPNCKTKDLNGPLVGAHYFLWYGNGHGAVHWNDNLSHGGVNKMPQLGYYPSYEGTIIEQHLKMMENAGIDFIVCNLHVNENGVSFHELKSLETMSNVLSASKSAMKFAIQICPYNAADEQIFNLIKDIKNLFFEHESYLSINCQPTLFMFWTGSYDNNRLFLAKAKKSMAGITKIATSLRMYTPEGEAGLTSNLFDGWTMFSPLELGARENRKKVWQQAWDSHTAGNMGLRIATISPGYDDRHLQSDLRQNNPYRLVDRCDGQTYKIMQNFFLAQDVKPDIVLISSFNEFHENTHIEPTLEEGDQYLKSTSKFIEKVKK